MWGDLGCTCILLLQFVVFLLKPKDSLRVRGWFAQRPGISLYGPGARYDANIASNVKNLIFELPLHVKVSLINKPVLLFPFKGNKQAYYKLCRIENTWSFSRPYSSGSHPFETRGPLGKFGLGSWTTEAGRAKNLQFRLPSKISEWPFFSQFHTKFAF